MIPSPAATPSLEALTRAVTEVEAYVAEDGWNRPRQLFALVPTAELLAHEPGLLGQLGESGDGAATGFTPVEQGEFPGETIGAALAKLAWPDAIVGCILVLEIVVDGGADHHDEGRLAVGVMRGLDGGMCALRWRHAPAGPVTYSPDLAPELVEALHATFS